MPKLVCVPCKRDYKIIKSGNYVVEMFLDPPQPYKIQNGDRWECPKCGHQIIAGFAHGPLAEHFQDNFGTLLIKVEADENTIHCYEKG